MKALKVYLNERSVYCFAIFTSLLLSVWACFREIIINPDAVCYLLSAEKITQEGITAAMKLCGQAEWPFYSFLIHLLTQALHLSSQTSAYILNSLFSAMSVVMFIAIVKELNASKRIVWLAAAVILLAHEFNSVRNYIIRDHGYWAFYLASIYCLLRYFKTSHLAAGLGWGLCLFIAALFRIEGVIFLLAVPFLCFLNIQASLPARVTQFFILNLPLLLAALLGCIWFIFHPQQTIHEFGRLKEIPIQWQQGLTVIAQHFIAAKTVLAKQVLTEDAVRQSGLVLSLLLVVWYCISVIGALSFTYCVLLIAAFRQKLPRTAWLVIGGYLCINIVITFSFLLEHFFLSKRYLMALVLLLMLGVPFAINNLLPKRFLLVLAMCFLLASAAGGIFNFGYSKAYIYHAGLWLSENVPVHAKLYSNDYQLMYYSKHYGDAIFTQARRDKSLSAIAQGQWKHYDYLALRIGKHDDATTTVIEKNILLTPVRVFSNKRGDRVVIYKVRS